MFKRECTKQALIAESLVTQVLVTSCDLENPFGTAAVMLQVVKTV